MPRKSVLVTGANGYIGSAVCRAFVRAGWQVFGLVRRLDAAGGLEADEITPIVGSLSDLSFLDSLFDHTKTFEVIVGCTEPPDYASHFHEAMAMFRRVAEVSNSSHVRPLVLWTSGCKDYGTTAVDGDPDLGPHTEVSPLNTPAVLSARATYSLKVLEQTDLFDATVLRPTNVFGYSSSYYGVIFEYAAKVVANGAKSLRIADVDPRSIMHAMHVDDCAEAYVALAEHGDRAAVFGQCFNISASEYETAEAVAEALAREYGLSSGAEFVAGSENSGNPSMAPALLPLLGFSQWVGSDKIRDVTGWTDRRPLFSQNLSVYRRSYEAAVRAGHEDIARIQGRQEFIKSALQNQ
ncbi:hypothetical protein JX265_011891 [Neoarthrinium moseri]|uniref:NAD-dependent epimerase/dehydratase domain-containing protein n=1 Tax=Neoarthrinium moseri TaxID=1658444 RepID=A0A9Q0AJ00_9PEZI|nr:hypothetical protein JX265_011891 [Neoarthrinium moseri]